MENELTQEEIEKRIQLMKENCLFCKIVKKEFNSYIVFEDEICMAILDINPATKGHLLLIPKEHYMILPTVPDNALAHLSVISKYLRELLIHSLGAEDALVYMANGAASGQQAQHYMIHIIAQYEDENYFPDLNGENISREELESLRSKLVLKLNSLNEKFS